MDDKPKILLIDDEETFTRALKSYIERTGRYEVYTANHGTQGLELALSIHPDLILLDVIMPEMDGGQIAGRLKENVRTQHIPIIFLTAVVSRDELQNQEGLIGGQMFIAKPVGAKDILTHIEQHLSRTENPKVA